MELIEIIKQNRDWDLHEKNINILYLSNINLIPIDEVLKFNAKLLGINSSIKIGTLNNIVPEIIDNSEKYDVTIVDLDLSAILQDDTQLEANFKNKIEFLTKFYDSLINQLETNFPITNNLIITKLSDLSYRSMPTDAKYVKKFVTDFNNTIDKLNFQNKIVINKQEIIEIIGTERAIKSEYISANPSPYTLEFIKIFGEILSAAISSIFLPYKKLIVLDCDNTLWGGEIGEIDTNHTLNGYLEDPNAVFKNLQTHMKDVQKNGIMLALSSKNEEKNVRKMFDANQMVLKWSDFVNTKINWVPKSENIKNICSEINIDPNSAIFIDDSWHEIFELVHSKLGVSCLVAPRNTSDLKLLKLKLDFLFRNRKTTHEDLNRQTMLNQDKLRKSKAKHHEDYESFLKSLNTRLLIKKLNIDSSFERSNQLSQKTNQFNFMQQRFNVGQLIDLIKRGNFDIFTGSLVDEIGELGEIVLLVSERDQLNKEIVHIIEFNMSCRVFGRGVAEMFLNEVQQYYKKLGIKKIRLSAKFNEKNLTFKDFFTTNNFREINRRENNVDYESLLELNSPSKINYINVERKFL